MSIIDLYGQWCRSKKRTVGRNKKLWRLTEQENGRKFIWDDLCDRVRDHYVSNSEFRGFIDTVGYPEAAKLIRELLPLKPIGQSGDLGEILATEFVEENLSYQVPIRRLRYKDHREMPMRGDDMIGIACRKGKHIRILKGEAKSARRLSSTTVTEARRKLDENHGQPSPHSLVFIARMLIGDKDTSRNNTGKDILRWMSDEAMPKRKVTHLLFTLCSNQVKNIIRKDIDAADSGRKQFSVNLRIKEHQEFVSDVYKKASSSGND